MGGLSQPAPREPDPSTSSGAISRTGRRVDSGGLNGMFGRSGGGHPTIRLADAPSSCILVGVRAAQPEIWRAKNVFYRRATAILALVAVSLGVTVWSHQPHDIVDVISLSPGFAQDRTVFTAAIGGTLRSGMSPLKSQDGGVTFARLVRGFDNRGSITAVLPSPRFESDQTVFVATDEDGLYRSTNGGDDWANLTQPPLPERLSLASAGINRSGRVVVLVAGRTGGLFGSEDMGQTWARLLPDEVRVSTIALASEFRQTGLAAVGDATGRLFLSEDGARTWRMGYRFEGMGAIMDIAFAPSFAVHRIAFVATAQGGAYRTEDAGASWQPINDGLPDLNVTALELSPDFLADRTVFLTTREEAMLRSTDAGNSWTKFHSGLHTLHGEYVPNNYRTIAVSPDYARDGVVYLGAYEGFFVSTDRGETWTESWTRPPTLVAAVAMSPGFGQDRTLAVARYGGGVCLSNDAGQSWKTMNVGLKNPYVYDIAFSNDYRNDRTLVAAHVDLILISTNGGRNWSRYPIDTQGQFNGQNVFPTRLALSPSYASDGIAFAGTRAHGGFRSADGGRTWARTFRASRGLIGSVAVSPQFSSDATVFISAQDDGVYRSRDGGLTWLPATTGLPLLDRAASLAISPSFAEDSTIFAGTRYGLYLTDTAGNQWRTATDQEPIRSGVIETIAVSPNFRQDRSLLATVRGHGLFASNDAGSTWTPVGNDLWQGGHQFEEMTFAHGPSISNVAFGGAGSHLFLTTDGGVTWRETEIGFVRHEDSKSQAIVYSGEWTRVPSSKVSGGFVTVASASGDAVGMSFFGESVSWIGVVGPNMGRADVFIDGQFVERVDLYRSQQRAGVTLFESGPLQRGPHQVRLVATGDANQNSSGTYVAIDAFDVYD